MEMKLQKIYLTYYNLFIASSLSHPVNNLSKGIRKIKCKYGHDDKKSETCVIKNKYWDCFLE